jgi:hypothetical protein
MTSAVDRSPMMQWATLPRRLVHYSDQKMVARCEARRGPSPSSTWSSALSYSLRSTWGWRHTSKKQTDPFLTCFSPLPGQHTEHCNFRFYSSRADMKQDLIYSLATPPFSSSSSIFFAMSLHIRRRIFPLGDCDEEGLVSALSIIYSVDCNSPLGWHL